MLHRGHCSHFGGQQHCTSGIPPSDYISQRAMWFYAYRLQVLPPQYPLQVLCPIVLRGLISEQSRNRILPFKDFGSCGFVNGSTLDG